MHSPQKGKRDVNVLIPGMLLYMTKKDFAGIIKLRIFRWEDYPGLLKWTQDTMTCVLIRRRQRRGGHVITDAEIGVMSSQSKEGHSHQELEKAMNRFFPGVSRGSTALLTP